MVASIQSLLQPVPSRETLERQTRSLRVGDAMAVGDLTRWLAESGLVSTPAVDLPGEFAVRGGIVDVFAPDWDWPVRVEFFGDQIESIRRFEISSQRSLASLESVDVTILGPAAGDRAHLADYLPPQSWFLLLEPMELEQQGRQYLERMEQRSRGGSNDECGMMNDESSMSPSAPAFIIHHSSFIIPPFTPFPTSCGRSSAFPRWPRPPWPRRRWKRLAG